MEDNFLQECKNGIFTRECKNSEMDNRKRKIRKWISLQNVF